MKVLLKAMRGRSGKQWQNILGWILLWTASVAQMPSWAMAQDQPSRTRPRRATVSAPTPKQTERRARPRRVASRPPQPEPTGGTSDVDLEIAAHFAPIIYQGLDGSPRFDYITNFDFDGDWQGDNNWRNAEDPSHPLRAYVYYSVIETESHFFIHYITFHPRDYKGGFYQSWLLSQALRRSRQELERDWPPGAEEAPVSHENDMNGCLVVVEKRGSSWLGARVAFVETMAQNRFHRYRTATEPSLIGFVVTVEGSHPLLFSEPKGHGLWAYTGRPDQLDEAKQGVLVYVHGDRPEDPEQAINGRVRYRLIPVEGTLWQRARDSSTDTYAESIDYGTITVSVVQNGDVVEKECRIGVVGSAFRGAVGAPNRARPPWAWSDYRESNSPPGEWFFDPAGVIKRHFRALSLSTAYVHHPFLDIWRQTRW